MASGEKAKARDIIAAIRTLKAIESEKRPASNEEKQSLARFSGFGPVAAFDIPQSGIGQLQGCRLAVAWRGTEIAAYPR
jgi:hypothetical protein